MATSWQQSALTAAALCSSPSKCTGRAPCYDLRMRCLHTPAGSSVEKAERTGPGVADIKNEYSDKQGKPCLSGVWGAKVRAAGST